MQRARAAWLGAGALALAGVVGAILVWSTDGEDPAREALRRRGPTLVVGSPALATLELEGTRWLQPEDVPGADAALHGGDPATLVEAMEAVGARALLAAPAMGESSGREGFSVAARLSTLDRIEGLRGQLLRPDGALYLVAEPLEVGDDPDLLALLARGMLRGRRPPALTAFPEELRRLGSVEVMVMLRQNGQARLWRSARDSSIAKALITASTVARQRWEEREAAMGGPLDRQLPRMDVEVSLLEEDGTLGSTRPDFVERAITPAHGVAYEQRGAHRAWRYLLPDATAREGRGSAVAAYEALFRENDLPPDSFDRPDLRFYRLVVRTLGRSPGSTSSFGALPEPGVATGRSAEASTSD